MSCVAILSTAFEVLVGLTKISRLSEFVHGTAFIIIIGLAEERIVMQPHTLLKQANLIDSHARNYKKKQYNYISVLLKNLTCQYVFHLTEVCNSELSCNLLLSWFSLLAFVLLNYVTVK